ncbi:MAG: prepilin-type N-terminal cleavage/methylation domain-containing protein [Comamonadaceae bacterium]|nr:MAG: prepilin-type N-terminal cleavage/methylation domain-containing protein [Comamonadaceae bacterium]
MSRRHITGFTLLELMVTVSIAAILLALALPSFQSSMRSNRVATATNELLASLALARSEAVRNTRGAGLCTSADGASCGGGWNSGWLVWADTNGDGLVDAGETVIRYSQGKASTTITGAATSIAFTPRGRVVGDVERTIGIVPYDASTPARCVTINRTGQTRVAQTAC